VLLHRARDVLDRHVRIDTVLVIEVDRVDPKPLERAFDDLLDVLGPTVERTPVRFIFGGGFEPELRGNHHLPAEWSERLADELLVRERSVKLRGVEEGDAALHGGSQERDRLPLVGSRTQAKAQAHRPEAERRALQVAVPESSLLHPRCSSTLRVGWRSYSTTLRCESPPS